MYDLLTKLNYKEQERIAVINAEKSFLNHLKKDLSDTIVDLGIDPRYPYGYMILFVRSEDEINRLTPAALHNLTADGVLWFCYPKKTSKKYKVEIDRDHGWQSLTNAGFRGIRMVSIDENWSAMRFRNIRYIKTVRGTSGKRI